MDASARKTVFIVLLASFPFPMGTILATIKAKQEKFLDPAREFSGSFVGSAFIIDSAAADSKKDPMVSQLFWRQLFNEISSQKMLFTIVSSYWRDKGTALVKTRAVTAVMVVNKVTDLQLKMLDFGIRYPRTMRFRIAVLSPYDAMTDREVAAKVKASIEPQCTSRSIKFLSMTTWYLVERNMWFRTVAYPDDENVCVVELMQGSDLAKADKALGRSITDFKGHPITIASIDYAPFVNIPEDVAETGSGEGSSSSDADPAAITGPEFALLKEFGKTLNFSLLVRKPKDGKWGSQTKNGSWNGIIGMVQAREADVGCSGLVAVPTSRLAIRYLQPWEDECLRVITRTPLNLSAKELFAIFLPFPSWLWLTLAALTGITASLAYLIERNRGTPGADWVVQVLWYFSAQLGLGAPDYLFGPSTGTMMRAIWMCWLWFTFLISTAYSTFLVSYMTVPKYEVIPGSIQDFLASEYKLGRVQWGDAIDDQIKRSEDVVYAELRKRLKWFQPSAGWNNWTSLQTIGQKFGLVEQYSDAWTAVLRIDPDQFMLSDATWSCSPTAWAGPWNGIFNDPLNAKLKPLARFGILARMRQRAREGQFERYEVDRYDYGKSWTTSVLHQDDEVVYLQNLVSVFFVLGIGYVGSILAFVGEWINYYCTWRQLQRAHRQRDGQESGNECIRIQEFK